ncbi:MAG: 50S ribosomal protein L9 [Candidatus Aureabacteria bacterium]|nr:50S ribosomal protein L9 [Candidatus Auribacterota bacterium]
MKLILEKTVPKLGLVGEVVDVAEGYARNYLLPKRFGVKATKHNLDVVANRVKTIREKELQELENAKKLSKTLEGLSVNLKVKAGDDGKLFGSVTEAEIAEALKEKGYDFDKKLVDLDKHIKFLGIYTVPLKLHPLVSVNIKVWVIRESSEA